MLGALLEAVSPAAAIITSADEAPEDEQTLDLLAQYGVETWLTRQAPVVLHADGSTIELAYE